MRIYRCESCKCGFAILAGQKRAGKVSCPLCSALPDQVTELDPVEAIGAKLAKKALELWNRLPSGD